MHYLRGSLCTQRKLTLHILQHSRSYWSLHSPVIWLMLEPTFSSTLAHAGAYILQYSGSCWSLHSPVIWLMPEPTFSSTLTHNGAYMLPALWHILGPTFCNTVARTALLIEDLDSFHTLSKILPRQYLIRFLFYSLCIT
jgi:hypothetical protein